MKIIKKKISDLILPEKNVRIHTEQQINEFQRSLEMFGQTRPAVIDENNTVLIGNGMVQALIKLGKDTVECYRVANLSEKQKKKLMISDNKIFNLGIDNLDVLNSFLEELQDDLDVPGYPVDLLESMTATADEISETLSEYGTLDEDEIEQIKDNKERKESKIEAAEKQETSTTEENSDVQVQPPNTSTAEMTTEKYVVCPKCGEKIWL